MYQDGNRENRANRISFYSFNLTGGLGAGSYFQDPVTSAAGSTMPASSTPCTPPSRAALECDPPA
jgi:hypothetical protein